MFTPPAREFCDPTPLLLFLFFDDVFPFKPSLFLFKSLSFLLSFSFKLFLPPLLFLQLRYLSLEPQRSYRWPSALSNGSTCSAAERSTR